MWQPHQFIDLILAPLLVWALGSALLDVGTPVQQTMHAFGCQICSIDSRRANMEQTQLSLPTWSLLTISLSMF
jgi:hypothetical protein